MKSNREYYFSNNLTYFIVRVAVLLTAAYVLSPVYFAVNL